MYALLLILLAAVQPFAPARMPARHAAPHLAAVMRTAQMRALYRGHAGHRYSPLDNRAHVVRMRCVAASCGSALIDRLRIQAARQNGNSFTAHAPAGAGISGNFATASIATPPPPAVQSLNSSTDFSQPAFVGGWGCGAPPNGGQCVDTLFGTNIWLHGHTPSVYLTISCANGSVGGYATIEPSNGDQRRLDFTLPRIPVPVTSFDPIPSTPAQIVVSNGVTQSDPINVRYLAQMGEVDVQGAISDQPAIMVLPPARPDYPQLYPDANLSPGNVYLAWHQDHRSAIPVIGQGGKGNDVIGANTRLLNGYRFMMDADPIDDFPGAWLYAQDTKAGSDDSWTSPADANDSWGARLTNMPSGDSLETHVHWYYDAGHGIAYSLDWPLYGPVGLRPVSTMPYQQGGVCEQ